MSKNRPPDAPADLPRLQALNNSAMGVSILGCTTSVIFTAMALATGQKDIAFAYAAVTAAQGTLVALNVSHAYHSRWPTPRLNTDTDFQKRRVTSAWRRLAVTTVCAGAQAMAGISMLGDLIAKDAPGRQAAPQAAPFRPSR